MPPALPEATAALLAHELALFDRDYRQHFLHGETKPPAIGRPYLLHYPNARAGVLLVHGLMAAPEEVAEWAQDLFTRGYTVFAPRMAGHGTSAVDLDSRSPEEWIASVDRGHSLLLTCCQQIVIAGFSTGGAVALQQVISKPDAFAALISVSAPLSFKKFSARFAQPLAGWNEWASRLGLHRLTHRFVTNHADNPHINYLRCPVSSIAHIQRMMAGLRAQLRTVAVPALVLHADNDPKVDVASGRELHRRLGSRVKRYREIRFDLHGIVRGDIAREVFAEVGDFLRQTLTY